MQGLYHFEWNFGRAGLITGVFIADSETITRNVGKYVCFGEVLGKHSWIEGHLEENDFTLITVNPDFIKEWEDNVHSAGLNPLHYIEEMD